MALSRKGYQSLAAQINISHITWLIFCLFGLMNAVCIFFQLELYNLASIPGDCTLAGYSFYIPIIHYSFKFE